MTCSRIVTLALVVVLIAPVIHLAPRAVAQEAADELTAGIHAGACGGVVGEPAASLVPPDLTDGDAVGAAEARPVATSFSTVPVSLDALLADGHVVAIGKDQKVAACGAIGGLRTAAGALAIELSDQGDSGLSGVAYLADSGANTGQTDVSLFLAGLGTTLPGSRAEPTTEPSIEANATAGQDAVLKASNTPSSEMTTEVTVTITTLGFDPDPVITPVGGTVTWINNDGVPHTVTGDDGTVFESGVLMPLSGSYSQTFTEPGIYAYHSEFNPDLHGTVIVEPASGLPPDATAEPSQQGFRDSTAEPTEEAATRAEIYVSPTYGFSLSYNPTTWTVSQGPVTEGSVDAIGFSTFGTEVLVGAFPYAGDAQSCAADLVAGFTQEPNVISWEPLLAGGVPVVGGSTGDAFQAVVLTRTEEDLSTFEQAFYVRCIELIPGAAMVGIQQWSAVVFYDVAAQQREELVAGLVLP